MYGLPVDRKRSCEGGILMLITEVFQEGATFAMNAVITATIGGAAVTGIEDELSVEIRDQANNLIVSPTIEETATPGTYLIAYDGSTYGWFQGYGEMLFLQISRVVNDVTVLSQVVGIPVDKAVNSTIEEPYVAPDLTNLLAANVKKSVDINGVVGTYPVITSGTGLLTIVSLPTDLSTDLQVYTKVIDVTLNLAGTYLFYFNMGTSTTEQAAYAKVYVNGEAYSEEYTSLIETGTRSDGSIIYGTHVSSVVTVSENDEVQLYIKSTLGSACRVGGVLIKATGIYTVNL